MPILAVTLVTVCEWDYNNIFATADRWVYFTFLLLGHMRCQFPRSLHHSNCNIIICGRSKSFIFQCWQRDAVKVTCVCTLSSLTLLAGLVRLNSAGDIVYLVNEISEDGLCASRRIAAFPEAGGVDAGHWVRGERCRGGDGFRWRWGNGPSGNTAGFWVVGRGRGTGGALLWDRGSSSVWIRTVDRPRLRPGHWEKRQLCVLLQLT